MDQTTITKFGKLEAAMSFRWAITLLSAIAFVDSYSIIVYEQGLSEVTTEWVKINLGLIDLVCLIVMFSVTFGMILPGLGFAVVELWSYITFQRKVKKGEEPPANFYKHSDLYVTANDYREWAIKNSNSAAYKDYENAVAEWKDIKFIRYMCQCCVLLTLFSCGLAYFLENDIQSYYQVVTNYLESLAWYISIPIGLVIAYIGLFLLGIGFDQTIPKEHYIKLNNHGIDSEK
ncbi:hypothetical protein MA781_000628 [Vibrio parahaemolyticus]|nr:hypothetical protein [Vibrio parahaemolyticus]EIV8671710.1 hypothetical protein [Vibrio parahaemolyticus]